MRVLILGGTGFLGSQIARRLQAFGHSLTVFHRGCSPLNAEPGVAVVHGDRNRLDQSADDLRRLRPDVVVDAIAFTEAHAESLIKTFRGYAGRIVVLSSGDVYRAYDILYRRTEGPVDRTPLTESSPLRERLYPYRGVPIAQRYGFLGTTTRRSWSKEPCWRGIFRQRYCVFRWFMAPVLVTLLSAGSRRWTTVVRRSFSTK